MDLDRLDKALLLGDETEVAVPPSLLASDAVLDLSFHPTLPILAAGLVNGEVEIFEYKGNEIVKRPLQNDFSSWIFSPNATYKADEIVLNHHHDNMRMHPTGGAGSVEFTDDGTYLVSASSDRSVSVMDCVSARLVIHIPADTMKKLSESKKKVMGSAKQRAVPFKRKSMASKRDAAGHPSVVATRNVNPHRYGISALNICDENLIATGDDDGLIAIWDMRTRRPAHTYHEHGDYVSQLCYFTDVQELISSSGDTCLGVYDMRAGKIKDYSEKRNDELTCFTFINGTAVNNASFIPSIICGTPGGSLPLWKYGSWARPYDAMESHPYDCDAMVSFHGDDTTFNHNIILTGAGDGLVRVLQMYPLRRNLCQLSARDYSYSQANSYGIGAGGVQQHHNSSYIVKKKRGQEGISRMRVNSDSSMLAVSGTDNIIDFVDIRFLSDEKQLDTLRNKSERRHMQTIRTMESERAAADEKERILQERLARGESWEDVLKPLQKNTGRTESAAAAVKKQKTAVAGAGNSDDDDDDDDDDDSSDGTVSTSSDDVPETKPTSAAPVSETRDERNARIRAIIIARGGVQKRRRQQQSSSSSESTSSSDEDAEDKSDADEKDSDSDDQARGKKRKAGAKQTEPSGKVKSAKEPVAKSKRETPQKQPARTQPTPQTEAPVEADAQQADAEPPKDPMQAYEDSRQERRDRVAAAQWLKNEKKKKVNFTFEKRRRRVNGFFADMFSGAGPA